MRGCLIAAGVGGALALVCGGVVTYAGWALWQSPAVQRGVSLVGAAMDLSREAMTAPGTREMRAAGCHQAMAFTPELMQRFLSLVAPDGGLPSEAQREPLPEVPTLLCTMARGAPEVPSCESVARAYASGAAEGPREAAVRVSVQGEASARCEGLFGASGERVGDLDARAQRTFGRFGAPVLEPPPSTEPAAEQE